MRYATTTLMVLVVLSGSALSSPDAAPTDALHARSRTATIHFRTIHRTDGWPGEVNYFAKVLEWNGKRVRFRTGYLRGVQPGTHTFKIRWWNTEVPPGSDQPGPGARKRRRGIKTLTLKVEAGYFYEMQWPVFDEFGGPTGFKKKRRRR